MHTSTFTSPYHAKTIVPLLEPRISLEKMRALASNQGLQTSRIISRIIKSNA
jgi:hypothetical protein